MSESLRLAREIMALVDETPSEPFSYERKVLEEKLQDRIAQFVYEVEEQSKTDYDLGYEDGYNEGNRDGRDEVDDAINDLENEIEDLKRDIEDARESGYREGFDTGYATAKTEYDN